MSFESNNFLLQDRTVAVVGYGSQGRAQALNLHDSGARVIVGVRDGGPSWARAAEDGLERTTVAAAVGQADLVALLVPDMEQPAVFEQEIRPHLRPGAALLFSHGFNVHYGQLEAGSETPVVMVAPKGPGNLVRRTYEEGRGVPCLAAVHQDPNGDARDVAYAYAELIGGARAGVIDTTFAEETETDLFGEQAVLCGGVTELVTAGGILLLLPLKAGAVFLLLPVLGAALNGTSSVLYGSVVDFVVPQRQARAFGLFYTIAIGSGAIAPLIYGLLSDATSVRQTMATIGIVALATVPLALLLAWHRTRTSVHS